MHALSNIILAIDAALGPCSVAVLRGVETLAFLGEDRPQMQARRLVPMVEEALREAGIAYGGLDKIICTVGPGMFTGLRIGLAAARGIGFAAKKPVSGVSTLAATVIGAGQAEGKVLVALNAGKGEAYCQLFHVKQKVSFDKQSEATLATPEALLRMAGTNTPVIGNIPPEWAAGRAFIPAMPDARAAGMAALLAPALLTGPEPFYIRLPDAKLPA